MENTTTDKSTGIWTQEYAAPAPMMCDEYKTWGVVAGGWKHLFGSYVHKGLSVEWHDFSPGAELDWGASFHPGSLEICINLQGSGKLGTVPGQTLIGPQNVAIYRADKLQATRKMGEHHQFLTLEISREYLALFFTGKEHNLTPMVRAFIRGEEATGPEVIVRPMVMRFRTIIEELLKPPVQPSARELWFQAKFLEVAAELFFEQPGLGGAEPFCVRQKQISQDRVERVKELLLNNLSQPATLPELGEKVGCSPFHLSRIFSQETGMTIPQFLKNARMERAAELLRGGRFNVTETAYEVGYSSLSHFSKVFYETYGCCPGLYPNTRLFEPTTRRRGRPSTSSRQVESAEVERASLGA
jgi:AraC-like DNA-binding protein